jgi:hypothetical protein
LSSQPPPLSPEELAVKAAELEVRRLEAAKVMATISSPRWRRADPLVLAIFAGALTLLGNMAVAHVNNYNSVNHRAEKIRE